MLFCSLTGLYNERQGMAVPWPDYQSMFLLSSAALALARALSAVIAGMLYGVKPADITIIAGAALFLAAIALLAAFLPARRASRIDSTSPRPRKCPHMRLASALAKNGLSLAVTHSARAMRRRASVGMGPGAP